MNMNMKRLGLAALMTVLAAGVVFSGGKKEKEFTLFTWNEMFPQEILDGFEKTTGCKINYQNFDYDETMLTRLETSGGAGYDLVIADDYIIQTAIAKGLVQKIDKKKIANYGNIDPTFQGKFFDPTNEYTVPYGAGLQTIMYDPAKVPFEITKYADLWNPALKNSIGIIGAFRVVDGIALQTLGYGYNTTDLNAIKQAGEKLIQLAPNIRLIKDDNLHDDLLSGEISVACMYTGQVVAAGMASMAKPGLNLKLVYPQEGVGFGIMAGFIPSKAKNPDLACAFLDYILDPERGARCFEHLCYYSTFKASNQYISDEYKPFLIMPDSVDRSRMEMVENIPPEAEEAHNLIWTAFKAAAGQ